MKNALVFLALTFLATAIAHAEDQVFGQSMIQIGAGGERTLSAGEMNVLARFALTTRQGTVLKHFTTAYGRVNGEVAISHHPAYGHLPYLNIELVPMVMGHSDFEGQHTGLRVAPIEVTRFIALNEEISLRVSLFGVQTGTQVPISGYGPDPKAIVFINMVADLLGYKWVERLRGADGGDGVLHGLNVAAAVSEAGIKIRFTENIRGRMLLGLKTDTTFGRRDQAGSTISMRNKLYAQVSADIQDFAETFRLSIFAQSAGYAVFERGMDRETELQLIFGAQAAF